MVSLSARPGLRLTSKTRYQSVTVLDVVTPTSSASVGEQTRDDARVAALCQDLTVLRDDPNVERIEIEAIGASVAAFLQRRRLSGDAALPFMVGYGGPSAGGKTTNCANATSRLFENFHRLALTLPGDAHQIAAHVSMDGFYKDKAEPKIRLGMDRFLAEWDLDTPDSWKMDELQQAVAQARDGKPIVVHNYDYHLSTVVPGTSFLPKPLVYLFEGNHILNGDIHDGSGMALHELFDLKVYVHTDTEAMDRRWRNRVETMRDKGVAPWALEQFFANVVRAREQFVAGTESHAHLVFNTGLGEEAMTETLNTLTLALLKALHGQQPDLA